MLNLLKYEIQSRWGAVLGWGAGLAAFGALYISIFPEVSEQMADLADLSIYKAMGMELGSFEGFIASSVVQFIPIILGIYGIITSTGTLAGEEEAGTLELVLAMPLRRWQIVTVKAVAIGLAAFFMLVIAGMGNALVLGAVKTNTDVAVSPWQFFGVILSGWPLTFAFMMIGLFLGAYLPNRRSAALGTTLVFIAGYFGEMLVRFMPSFDWLDRVNLFAYYDSTGTVFSDGVQTNDILVLLGVALFFFLLAVLSFQRRNVTVGAWPWQRGRIDSA